MKIPKTFVSDKDLNEKYSHLILNEFEHKEPREIALEELMENDMKLLYGETTPYQQYDLVETAISKIVDDTFEGKITWEGDEFYFNPHIYAHNYPSALKKLYKAKTTVRNYRRERLIIPVIFYISENLISTWCFLHLGDKKGPCRNTYHKKVKQLATEYFKIDPKDFPR